MSDYKRLTKNTPYEELDLINELGYLHIYKRLQELEDKIENGELVENNSVTFMARTSGKTLVDKALKYDNLKSKIEQGLMVELPKPKWVVVQAIGGNYFVRERTPKATYYNGKWIFCYEYIEWVDIRFEYDTKAEAEQKLKELLKGDK